MAWIAQLVSLESETKSLIAILRLAYSGELAAGFAYRGHWRSLSNSEERLHIQTVENEEWHHRKLVGEMLGTLGSGPSRFREIRAAIIGRFLGFLCHFSGWLAPMYGAGRLESSNIREYESAARYARDCGRTDFVDCLLTMAEVEWEHEAYFRARVLSHPWARRISLWPQPTAKANIRQSFAAESNPSSEVAREGVLVT